MGIFNALFRNRKVLKEKLDEINTNNDAKRIVDDWVEESTTDLVAPLEEKWICTVCETPNISTSKFCVKCNYAAGTVWKCPNCGKIHPESVSRCSICKFNFDYWGQCTKCKKWYNTKQYKKCPNH